MKSGEPDFIGYTDKGLSIVAPDTEVRVVLFGTFLDEIVLVGFTLSQNCTETVLNIVQEDFSIQTDRRIVIIYKFSESKSVYKLCLKQKAADDVFDLPFYLVDDLRCSVSTDMPPRQYYFPMFVQISIVAALLVLSGLFSGLNLGLMSLTPQELTLILNSGSSKERKYAQMILPVRKSGNQLLCSLLIGNVCVNSAISILFDDLTSGYVALAISSAGIVVFGEIFPQALCVKKGLAVGAHTIWVTRFFMVLTFPLAYPISKVLDHLLGDEVVSYDRKRLMELIKLSTKNAIGPAEELKIAIGAFEMGDKTVKDVMTKIDDVFMIPINTVLNAKIVAQIVHSGYTRIPVYDNARDNVVSLLFVKDLAMLDPDDNFLVKTVCDYYRHPVRRVPENTPLRTMLEEFKKGEYHMALVDRLAPGGEKESKYELVGLVTLEDIVEEILQAEIVDETDMVTDNVHRTKLKKNNLHFMHLFNDEGSACQISLQMQVVTIQFLEGNFKAFSRDRIAQPILERVIRNHVHKVEVSHLTDINDALTSALPRKAKLYTKKQLSDKFILILEGRAVITIGQNSMNFEVGPWQYFGTEILTQFDDLIQSIDPQRQSIDSVANSTNNMLGQVKAVPSAISELDKVDNAGNRPSLPGVLSVLSTGSQQQFVDSTSQDVAKRIKFLPDFSLVIRSECTYLEISSQTYLAMVDASGASIAIDGVQPDVVSVTGQNPSIANFYVPISPQQQQSGNMEEINDLVDNKLKGKRNENGIRQLSFEMNESNNYLD
uniref:CNNM transmembrane domain-containing protein n=1 Tax=Meloidogyne javanica TaxID=6303 RepID=A0A915N641_MELJA